jgi:hypothetical protein
MRREVSTYFACGVGSDNTEPAISECGLLRLVVGVADGASMSAAASAAASAVLVDAPHYWVCHHPLIERFDCRQRHFFALQKIVDDSSGQPHVGVGRQAELYNL